MNVSSVIGRSVVFENDTESVMMGVEKTSLAACNDMLKLVLLTTMVFDEGVLTGRADSKAHSSSSALCVGGSGACDCCEGFDVNALKSKMDFCCGC